MNDIIETHPLTPTARVVIRVDQDAEVPRGGDWGTLVGFAKVDGMGDSRRTDPPAVHEPPVPLEKMFNALRWRRGGTPPFTDLLYKRQRDAAEQTVRWARIFTGLEVVWDDAHGGFWFRHFEADESGDATGQLEAIKAERDLYETWAEGGVYEVTLQRLETYARVLRNERDDVWELVNPLTEADVTTQWEDVPMQSLAGCYLDEEYPAEQVALDHFALSEAEEAAAEAWVAEANRNLAGAESPLASE